MSISILSNLFFILWILPSLNESKCIHSRFSANTTKHFFNDLSPNRLLQQQKIGNLRIYADYKQVKVGSISQINAVKRVTNITASFFYRLMKVPRVQRLYFPKGVKPICNLLQVPEKYISQGIIGDLGILVGNQNNPEAIYVAKSSPCAFLQSTKRPIWGMIMFNNPYLKFDQQGFQQTLFVAIHEMTHIIGFSAVLYELYPNGNPLKNDSSGEKYLSSPELNKEVQRHFGCNNGKGMLLEDQDGTLIASHWQRKVVGNEYMIASNKKGAYISRITLALLESSGWYYDIDYELGENTTWGKNKGCQFLNIDNCAFEQFCGNSEFSCDFQGSAIGKCNTDPFAGSCKLVKYYTNTICVDKNFQLKNLNSKLNALQRGGFNSKCFDSTYRQTGLQTTKLNNRCYIAICSFSRKFIFILVGRYILICKQPNQEIVAPLGLDGTLKCPSNFANYCENKQYCPYHCNKNGACVNGKCLCAGNKQFSNSCLDQSIYQTPIGNFGGFTNARKDSTDILSFGDEGKENQNKEFHQFQKITKRSINKKCIAGSYFDKYFAECFSCQEFLNCRNCDDNGCLICDNSALPQNGKC